MNYVSPLTPKKHQKEALSRLHERPSWPSNADVMAWLMDMGTGKTKVVLDEWGRRVAAGELSDLLVVAPAGSYRNWDMDRAESPSEMTKHLDPALREKLQIAAWVSGKISSERQVEALTRTTGPRALVVNVDAVNVERCRKACCAFITSSERGMMMVVDESTKIKSWRAKRTKHIMMLGSHPKVKARRILTGLVTPQSPLDLFSQFAFLDWRILDYQSFFAFRSRYAIMKQVVMAGRSINLVVGYRNVEELNRKIAPYSFRVTKEECLDLDPKVYVARDVDLSPEQRRMYDALKRSATAEIATDTHVTATSVITQMLRLHQLILGYAVDEQGEIHDVPTDRIAALFDILEEHQGKAVVWIPYRRTLACVTAALREKLGAEAVAEFHGGNRDTREASEERFKSDPACRVMVATQGAGSLGNNWVVADLVVYYGNTYDLEQRSQSEDRCHRIGQTKSVTYVDLVTRDTVDERILVALRKKINLMTAITGENYREWLI